MVVRYISGFTMGRTNGQENTKNRHTHTELLRKVGEAEMKINKYPIAEYDDLQMSYDDMDTDIRKWHRHLVKVRKNTKCAYCGAPVSKGDFALSESGFGDGGPFLIHDCIDCVDDLIAFHKGEIDSEECYGRWETRYKKYAEQESR